jgi:hypothetical protein
MSLATEVLKASGGSAWLLLLDTWFFILNKSVVSGHTSRQMVAIGSAVSYCSSPQVQVTDISAPEKKQREFVFRAAMLSTGQMHGGVGETHV